MRAILAAFIALLLSAEASAKVMVVVDRTASATDPPAEVEASEAESILRSIFQSYPASSYTFVPARLAKTEFCRTGLMVWGYGTAQAYSEQFDAVVHACFNGGGASIFTGYRPDSLCLNAKAPTVPQLMLMSAGVGTFDPSTFTNIASCSTGVAEMFGPGGGSGNHEGEGTVYPVGSAFGWFDANFSNTFRRGSIPAGGIRTLLASGANSYFVNSELGTGTPTANADSVGRQANPDTMMVWERLNAHRSGLSRVVFCSPFGSTGVDSASGVLANQDGLSVNWPVLLYALSHLDSLAGGKVFSGSPPINMGFTIQGVGTRSDRRHPGGIFAADTTVLKATCDSLRALGVPLTLLADPESLAVNRGDVAIWKRAGLVRFSPWVRVGMDTTVAGLGNASYLRPVDVFGRYRNRAMYGDSLRHAVTGSDSSIATLLTGAKDQLRSAVGGQFMSGFLSAPFDDWSPKNMSASRLDSLVWVMRTCGFTAVQINAQSANSQPGYRRPTANGEPIVNGWVARQESRSIQLSPFTGEEFKFLGHNGLSPVGSRLVWPNANDTIPPYCDVGCAQPNAAVRQAVIAWSGVFPRQYRNRAFGADQQGYADGTVGVTQNLDNLLWGWKRARIFAIAAQQLGGGDTQHPGRPGWYIIKHMAHAVGAINRASWGAKPLLRLTYAEDVTP